jgi:hypothetical protein
VDCSPTTQHSIEWPVWVNSAPDGPELRFPVYPEQRTSSDRPDWSVQCQQPLFAERRLPCRNESSCTERRRRVTAKSYYLQSPFGVQSCTRVLGGLDVS